MNQRAVMRLDDLTDSRILYEKRPPRFAFVLVSLVLLAIAGVVVWASTTPKTSVAAGEGLVESQNRTFIMSSVSGTVASVVAPNGSKVELGDPMILLESVDIDIERAATQARVSQLQGLLVLQDRYSAALSERENLFDPRDAAQAPFFHEFEALESQRLALRADPESLRAIGYTEVEIANVVRTNWLKADDLVSSALATSTTRAAELRGELEQLAARLAGLDAGSEQYTVRAAESGEVTLQPTVRPGTVMTAGQPVGTIASPEAGLEVRVYLPAAQRQFVAVGDPARVSISGLPPLAYDSLDGTVTAIDRDVTAVATGSEASPAAVSTEQFFGATIELDRYWIEGRDGARRELGNGTLVTAQIAYSEITVLEYVAGLIGFS